MNTLFFSESNKGRRLTANILIYLEGKPDYQGFLGKRRRKNRIAGASWIKKALPPLLTALPFSGSAAKRGGSTSYRFDQLTFLICNSNSRTVRPRSRSYRTCCTSEFVRITWIIRTNTHDRYM